jgi:uncharacterized damage-inducible protein DinB
MEPSQLIAKYLAGIQTIRSATAGMTREQLIARPVPGKWSTLEVVCHLADFEPIYAERMKRTVALDNPVVLSADEQRYAATLCYQDRDLEEELDLIERIRRNQARILRALPATAWQRTCIYRHDGKEETRTLERLVTLMANHIPHHVAFIAEKRRALGLTA